jgi:hypothetical protein
MKPGRKKEGRVRMTVRVNPETKRAIRRERPKHGTDGKVLESKFNQETKMKIEITNAKTGEKIEIVRDVCTTHPRWVHDQCGTASESELQHCLDGLNVSDWYRDGKHLGNDICGISMYEEVEA